MSSLTDSNLVIHHNNSSGNKRVPLISLSASASVSLGTKEDNQKHEQQASNNSVGAVPTSNVMPKHKLMCNSKVALRVGIKDEGKSKKKVPKTIRISISLPDPDLDKGPEFNFRDELFKVEESVRGKKGTISNGFGNDDDDDDDNNDDYNVKKIAARMEAKYGKAYSSISSSKNKRHHRNRRDDYADIGMGYDETDSFIDNTDGYDEIIPENVSTVHGGFYINSGALEFKTDEDRIQSEEYFSSDSSSEGEEQCEEEDEDDGDDGDDDDDRSEVNDETDVVMKNVNDVKSKNGGFGKIRKTKKSPPPPPLPPKRKRKIDSSDETDRENKTEGKKATNKPKKEKKPNVKPKPQTSVNNKKTLVAKKKLIQNTPIQPSKAVTTSTTTVTTTVTTTATTTKTTTATSNNNHPLPATPNTKKTVKELLKAKMADLNISTPIAINESVISPPVDSKSNNITELILPSNLPPDLLSIITQFKETMLQSNGSLFSSSEIHNQLFINLEKKCKSLDKALKISIYEYVSAAYPIDYEIVSPVILMDYTRHICLEDYKRKINAHKKKLSDEITKIMPSLIENYVKEKTLQKQREISMSSQENGEKTQRLPKRRFLWNDVTKRYLKEILLFKKHAILCENDNNNNDSKTEVVDTKMAEFIRNDLQILWPDGWMSVNSLTKIYNAYNSYQSSSAAAATTATTVTAPPTAATTTQQQAQQTSNKNVPDFGNAALSITPIIGGSSAGSNTFKRKICIIKKSDEGAGIISVKPLSMLKPNSSQQQNLMTEEVVNKNSLEMCAAVSNGDDNYGKIIDLSEKLASTSMSMAAPAPAPAKKIQTNTNSVLKNVVILGVKNSLKGHNKTGQSSSGNDIQKVMEDLKVLQKMSTAAPKLTNPIIINNNNSNKRGGTPLPVSTTSSSVITVNKNFPSKSSSSLTSTITSNSTTNHLMQRIDYNKCADTSQHLSATQQMSIGGYQDEFQKQLLFNALNPSKTPTTSTVTSNNSNKSSFNRFLPNSYQSSNITPQNGGHKNEQNNSGCNNNINNNMLDDMFANLINQYGYTKEGSTASKPS